LPEDN